MHNVCDIRDLTSKVDIKYDVTVKNIWKRKSLLSLLFWFYSSFVVIKAGGGGLGGQTWFIMGDVKVANTVLGEKNWARPCYVTG